MMESLLKVVVWIVFLGILTGKTQQAPASDAQPGCKDSNHTYYEKEAKKHCSCCRPGEYVTQLCTSTTDTQCRPCEEGKYLSSWNYAEKCWRCPIGCPPGQIERIKCSSAKRTVCDCEDGYHCTQRSALNDCDLCEPDEEPTPELPPASEPSITGPTKEHPLLVTFIVVGVVLSVAVALAAVALSFRQQIMEAMGDISNKVKKSQPETSGCKDTEKAEKTPLSEAIPEDGRWPIQETQKSESGECTLRSAHEPPM